MKKIMPISSKGDVKTHFDKLSDNYSENYSSQKSGKTFIFNTRLEIVRSLIEGQKGALLDCASGSGEITCQALMAGNYVAGTVVDLSERMLKLAESTISNYQLGAELKYVNEDIFSFLSGCEEHYDTILCLGLIAHTGNLSKLLDEISECLKPGGKLVLQSSLSTHIGIKMVRMLTAKKYKKIHGYSISYYSIKDVGDACNNAGLKLTSILRYGFSIPFGDRISSNANYFLEGLMSPLSRRFGSDAIFVIEKGC